MSTSSPWVLLGAAGAVAFCFALEWLWSAVLTAVAAQPRVQLQRLAQDLGDGFDYVARLKDAESPHRLAVHLARQVALVAGCFSAGLLAQSLGLPWPWWVGPAAGLALGLFVVEGAASAALALRDPKGTLRFLVRSVPLAAVPLWPFVKPVAGVLARARARAVVDLEAAEEAHEEQVEALIEAGEREGLFEEDEGRMMRGIADLDETLVREVMTPRPDIEFIDAGSTVAEARRRLADCGHSKLPAHRGDPDDVIGVLHARDLFALWSDRGDEAPIREVLRDTILIPDALPLSEVLAEMRLKTRIAMVVDEYGSLAGLVTLQDVLEEIVGDIRDEHDDEEVDFLELPDGSWRALASASVRDFEERFEVDLGERDFDTLAGMIVHRLGRVPARGESVQMHGYLFEVLESDAKRVRTLRMTAVPEVGQAETGA